MSQYSKERLEQLAAENGVGRQPSRPATGATWPSGRMSNDEAKRHQERLRVQAEARIRVLRSNLDLALTRLRWAEEQVRLERAELALGEQEIAAIDIACDALLGMGGRAG